MEEQQRIDLNKFLKEQQEQEEAKQKELSKGTFVINDDDDGENVNIEKPVQEQIPQEEEKEIPDEIDTEIQQKIDTLIKKNNLIEQHDLQDLQIQLIKTKKQVKNQTMYKSFLGSYEERFLTVIPVEGELSFVVLKQN